MCRINVTDINYFRNTFKCLSCQERLSVCEIDTERNNKLKDEIKKNLPIRKVNFCKECSKNKHIVLACEHAVGDLISHGFELIIKDGCEIKIKYQGNVNTVLMCKDRNSKHE